MEIQRISSPSFGARIRIIKDPENFAKRINEIYKNMPDESKVLAGTSSTCASSGVATAVPFVNSTASGSYTAGAAFSLQQSGVDSFGIAPAIADKIAVSSSPSAAEFSQECPILAGGFFSGVGAWLQTHFRINFKVDGNSTKKIPS